MMEILKIAANGQWSLEKAVREPQAGSPASYENKPSVEGAGKTAKIRVGDPRHADRKDISETTRHGAVRDVPGPDPKKTVTSGVSELRPKKHSEYFRETSIDRSTQKPVKWKK